MLIAVAYSLRYERLENLEFSIKNAWLYEEAWYHYDKRQKSFGKKGFRLWRENSAIDQEIKALQEVKEENAEKIEKLKKTYDLMLIPYNYVDKMENGEKIFSIRGDEDVWNLETMDTDTRYGMLAWGVRCEE